MEQSAHDEALRHEIIESQNTQADFLKWKLITVAAVAAISLGWHENGPVPNSVKFFPCLIPVLCGYIDLISLHIMIRIVTIGVYLRNSGNRYEAFVFRVRAKTNGNPFVFEPIALHGSSLFFNLSIIILGYVLVKDQEGKWPPTCLQIFKGSGVLGLIWTLLLWLVYVARAERVNDLAGNVQPKTETVP